MNSYAWGFLSRELNSSASHFRWLVHPLMSGPPLRLHGLCIPTSLFPCAWIFNVLEAASSHAECLPPVHVISKGTIMSLVSTSGCQVAKDLSFPALCFTATRYFSMISKNVHFGRIHILGDSRNYTTSYQDFSRGVWDVVWGEKK